MKPIKIREFTSVTPFLTCCEYEATVLLEGQPDALECLIRGEFSVDWEYGVPVVVIDTVAMPVAGLDTLVTLNEHSRWKLSDELSDRLDDAILEEMRLAAEGDRQYECEKVKD